MTDDSVNVQLIATIRSIVYRTVSNYLTTITSYFSVYLVTQF